MAQPTPGDITQLPRLVPPHISEGDNAEATSNELGGSLRSRPSRRIPRAGSTSNLSSSYNRPTRSYFHHAAHGTPGTTATPSYGPRLANRPRRPIPLLISGRPRADPSPRLLGTERLPARQIPTNRPRPQLVVRLRNRPALALRRGMERLRVPAAHLVRVGAPRARQRGGRGLGGRAAAAGGARGVRAERAVQAEEAAAPAHVVHVEGEGCQGRRQGRRPVGRRRAGRGERDHALVARGFQPGPGNAQGREQKPAIVGSAQARVFQTTG
jgi:hypothetical protein